MANWAERKYSRNQIEKAGKLLITEDITEAERLYAQEVLDNWRACHSYPMNTFQVTLRWVARKFGRTAIVAQRLKRTPSILNKLREQQHMSLKRMQDIAGCRAIVSDMKQVNDILNYYRSTATIDHELVKIDNYLIKPKKSGYRSVHLIYKYKGSSTDVFDDQLVEIQLRTHLQHCWATAVETVDTMNGTAIKSGRGEPEWDRFFQLVSSVFAIEEKTESAIEGVPTDPVELIKETASLSLHLNVAAKLMNFSALFKLPPELKRAEYYLMVLDPDSKILTVTGFSKRESAIATERYEEAEERTRGKKGVQVVLVSAGSVQALKKAYPNYYADTSMFVQQLTKILKADNDRKSVNLARMEAEVNKRRD